MKKIVKFVCFVAALAVACCVFAAFLPDNNRSCSELISTIATILSIVLSVVAMIYSNISERQTSETLTKMIDQNNNLVNMIKSSLAEKNFDDANISDLSRRF